MQPTENMADMGRTTIQVSDELADELYARKQRGDSYEDVIWRLIEQGGGERPASGSTEPDEPAVVENRQEVELYNSPADLSTVDFPQTADREAAKEAVTATVEHLMESGGATKGEVVLEVMPEHPVGYDADAALEQIEAGDRYRGAWWRKVVKPGLEAVDGVEKPDSGASRWRYVGEK